MYSFAPIPVLISQRAESTPHATAIDSISTGESLSWQDVDQNCRRWADAYRRLKVERGEYVVTLMPNTPDAIFAWLGCAWLRAIEVPVNTDYKGEWLTHAIATSRARIVVTSRHFAPALTLIADALEHVHIVVVYDAEPGDEQALEPVLPRHHRRGVLSRSRTRL